MKRTYHFVQSEGEVLCVLPSGCRVAVPLVSGLFKHASLEQLRPLLHDPAVARKYTILALQKAPWCVLRLFPRCLLEELLEEAALPTGRANALDFLLFRK